MADALYQFQFQMHEEAFSYLDKLAYNAQMFAGIPPQVYGGAGDPSIETFGGQQQQLNSALGKLNIYWENLKEEHAKADELAVNCAKDNLTADMKQVILERGLRVQKRLHTAGRSAGQRARLRGYRPGSAGDRGRAAPTLDGFDAGGGEQSAGAGDLR